MQAVLNILVVLLAVMCAARPTAASQPQIAPSISVAQEAEKGNYRLIDVAALWELYLDKSSNVLLVDTRQDWEYRAGHINDAVHFSMEPTWVSRLIQRSALAQKLGSDKEQILVFY